MMQIQYLYIKFSKIKIDLNINYLTPEIDITKLRLQRTLIGTQYLRTLENIKGNKINSLQSNKRLNKPES